MQYLLSVVRFPVAWNKALDAAARGENERALGYLMKIQRIAHRYPDISILTGLVNHWMGREEEALRHLERARKIVQHYSMRPEDKAYLMCCIAVAGKNAARKIGDEDLWLTPINYSEVNLAMVSDHYKRKFPLLSHPEWRE